MEPIILDGEVENGLDERGEVCCFDPSVLHSSTSNPNREFDDMFLRPSSAAQMSDGVSCLSPADIMSNSKHMNSHIDNTQPGSSPSDTRSDSPEDSSHGSSMDSPGPLRNDSLASTQSELFSPSSVGTERYLPAGWPNAEQLSVTDGAFVGQDQGHLSLKGDMTMDADLEISNNAMASAFDFDSAASSPSPLKLDMMAEKTKPQLFRQAFRGASFPTRRTAETTPPHSQTFTPAVNPFVFRRQGGSPAFVPDHTTQNSRYWENRSPHSTLEETFGGINMNGGSPLASTLSPSLNFRSQGQAFDHAKYPPGAMYPMNDPSAAIFHPNISLENYIRPQLIVHPTSLKSRVETQIPIKMTLYPMPSGVKKLRLPSHAISKPKFLAKSDTDRSPEILELRASVVCTSAMQDKKKRDRAFARARGEDVNAISPKDNSSDDTPTEDDTPLGGAEVKICSGCIQRERKRASRKKQRKPEEDELFQKDEEKRVVVFNTTELKDWTDPPRTTSGGSDPASPGVPLGAMQVELPMRIACYCRHQNEKVGFQVIFSISDHMDNIVAQGATNSIMITDDHKTHTATNYAATSNAVVADSQFPTAGVFAANPTIDMAKPFIHQAPYKLSHSATDLHALRNRQYPLTPAPSSHSQSGSSGAAVGLASRNLSRQASPTDLHGPTAKRRKQSGSGKAPSGLTMTRMEPSHPFSTPSNSTPVSSAASLPASIHSNGQSDQSFVSSSMAPQVSNGPPTPNNNDNVFFGSTERSHSFESQPQKPLMSAPSSAQPSRPGTPSSSSRSMSHDPNSSGASVQNPAWDAPPNLPPHQVPSMIHKLVPSEGSTTGGTEVTLLGSGFYPGMEVVFGDTLATTTTFWGEKCLNCLTPPSLKAGTVPVVFKHEHPLLGQQQPGQPIMPKPQIFFRYVDDRELQMYRIALGILGQKLRNPADAFQTAQQIMGGDSNNLWNLQNNFQNNGQQNNGQQRQAPANDTQATNVTELDAKMLVYLEFMDLDDSPGSPKYNSRSPSGQTLLHLACSLGLTRFVAGLLARGANPDVRDNNYNTPLHLASLSGHTHIVHRLRLAGANVSAHNLGDFTPADLATSLSTHQAVLVPSRHYRSRSAGSTPSTRRRLSSGSLDMFWENSSTTGAGDFAELSSDESDRRPNAKSRKEKKRYFTHSRGGSVSPNTVLPSTESESGIEVGRSFSPPAALVAWRNQLAGQINQFQQNVNRAFPNLPALPPMPALPDYQTHPMIQRISSLVPHRPTTSWSSNIMKDGWDRLTGTMSPPAYEDLYPAQESDEDYSAKKSSMVEAALDAAADQHFTSTPEPPSSRPTSAKEDMGDVQLGRKNISRQQQDRLRKTHARKMKRIRSDRNLFFIWIPLLILIVVAMLKNLIPDVWHGVKQGYEVVKSHYITDTADTLIRT